MRHLGHSGLALAVVSAAAAVLVAGCASARTSSRSDSAHAQVVERDFKISAPVRLAAGNVTLTVNNRGPDDHELIVVPLFRGSPTLPLRADGVTVDEETLQASEPGSLVPAQPGSVRQLRVHLAPGHYVFFCNMNGHYMGGMHADVLVQ